MPPEPPAGAELADAEPAEAELTAAELPAAELELVAEAGAAALADELGAALVGEPPAVLDEEQAAREPATAIAMHAVITVRRVVEERATLILPGVKLTDARQGRNESDASHPRHNPRFVEPVRRA